MPEGVAAGDHIDPAKHLYDDGSRAGHPARLLVVLDDDDGAWRGGLLVDRYRFDVLERDDHHPVELGHAAVLVFDDDYDTVGHYIIVVRHDVGGDASQVGRGSDSSGGAN